MIINKSDISRQGMDSIESPRACLPSVSRGGTVIIGCPPRLAFGPSQERVKDQASTYITSWGAAQQPSLILPSWGESQQTSSNQTNTVSILLFDEMFKSNQCNRRVLVPDWDK